MLRCTQGDIPIKLSWEQGNLTLDCAQLRMFPNPVYKQLQGAFAKVIRSSANHTLKDKSNGFSYSISVDLNGRVSVSRGTDFGQGRKKILHDPELERALAKVRDAAIRQQYLVSSYRVPAPPSPSPHSSLSEMASIAIDVNSFARNTCAASNLLKSFVPISAAVGGGLAIGVGLDVSRSGYQSAVQAARCEDTEGLVDGILMTGSGLSYTGLGACMSVTPFHLSQGVLAMLGLAANGLMIGMFGLILANAVLNYRSVQAFRNEFTEILDRPFLGAKEKAMEGLLFLQQQIALTEEDMLELKDKPEAQEKRLQEKWDRFVRRVGLPCAQAVAARSANLLAGIRRNDPNALNEAIALLTMVDRGNHQNKVKHITLIVIAILGLIAGALALTGVGVVASHILFAVSAVLWLLVDSSDLSKVFSDWIFQGNSLAVRDRRWNSSESQLAHSMDVGSSYNFAGSAS